MEETIYTKFRSFRKGLSEVKVKDLPHIKHDIMQALGISTESSFSRYSRGLNKHLDIEKAKKIEDLFASYGVDNCWGN
ncbi:MAG: hypothetical protein J6112_03230 [Clostridia bacterium]|nr:hypothetical protein [Clostridia bacterium]